jgi:hypothetical protein
MRLRNFGRRLGRARAHATSIAEVNTLGLRVSLASAEDKLDQIDTRINNRAVVIGIPTLPTDSQRKLVS